MEWIPITNEKLIPNEINCLVWDNGNNRIEWCWHNWGFHTKSGFSVDIHFKPTHYIPFPEPPKIEQP